MSMYKILSKIPVVGETFKRPIVPVIRLSGIINDSPRRGAIYHNRFRDVIDKAFDMPFLHAVALVINCPGGTPAQAELIGNHIRRRADENNIPVLAFIEDVAASGGYWLACAADEIYGAKSSITGSIGVISAGFGLDEFIKEYKIKRRVYTQGKEKAMLDPFQPEKESDVKRLTSLQKDLHAHFIEWVKSRRGDKLEGTKSSLFEGQIWTAQPAVDIGIMDGIGECDTVLKEKFGDDVRRIDLEAEKRLFPLPIPGFGRQQIAGELPRQIIDVAEEKSLWAQYGL